MSSPFEPSLVRRSIDELLRRHPHLDVVDVDWQLPIELYSASIPQRRWGTEMVGPWVLVRLGQRSESFEDTPAWALWTFAIWKVTGALYAVGADGAVGDDPLFELGEAPA